MSCRFVERKCTANQGEHGFYKVESVEQLLEEPAAVVVQEVDPKQVTALLPIFWSFLPDGLVEEVHMGDTKTVAAIRQLTVLFVKLKGIALGGDTVDQMQQTLLVMQTAINGHGGFIKEFSVDDKVGCFCSYLALLPCRPLSLDRSSQLFFIILPALHSSFFLCAEPGFRMTRAASASPPSTRSPVATRTAPSSACKPPWRSKPVSTVLAGHVT